MKTIILGIGNTIAADDGVGIYIARILSDRFRDYENVTVMEAPIAGFAVVPILHGYDRAFIIDSILTTNCVPGTLHQLSLEDFSGTRQNISPHHINLYSCVHIARTCESNIPEDITVFSIEIDKPECFSSECSPVIKKCIPELADKIFKAINEIICTI